jgi:hypothetical protein
MCRGLCFSINLNHHELSETKSMTLHRRPLLLSIFCDVAIVDFWALLRGAKEAFDVDIKLCSMGYAQTLTVRRCRLTL